MRLQTQVGLRTFAVAFIPAALIAGLADQILSLNMQRTYSIALEQRAFAAQSRLNDIFAQAAQTVQSWATEDYARNDDPSSLVRTHGRTAVRLSETALGKIAMRLNQDGVFQVIKTADAGRAQSNLASLSGTRADSLQWFPARWLPLHSTSLVPVVVGPQAFEKVYPDGRGWLLTAAPILGTDQTMTGVWIMATPLELIEALSMGRAARAASGPERVRVWILDPSGYPHWVSDRSISLENANPIPLKPGQYGLSLARSPLGSKAFLYLPSNAQTQRARGWRAVATLDEKTAFARPYYGGLWAAVALCLALSALGTWILSRFMQRKLDAPLTRLLERTANFRRNTVGRHAKAPKRPPSSAPEERDPKAEAQPNSTSPAGDSAVHADGRQTGSSLADLEREVAGMLADVHSRLHAVVAAMQLTLEQVRKNVAAQQSSTEEQSRAVQSVGVAVDNLASAGREMRDASQAVRKNAERAADNNGLVANRINQLTAYSTHVGDILGGMKDIATKGEVLALNAALEGSKAGPAGRSFGLVATQMRELALAVMNSATGLHNLTADVREATTSSILTAEEGTKLTQAVEQSAVQISGIIERQRSGAQEMTQSLSELSFLTEQHVIEGHNTVQALAELDEQHRELERLAQALRAGDRPTPVGKPSRPEPLVTATRRHAAPGRSGRKSQVHRGSTPSR